jgi:hypothetical protein
MKALKHKSEVAIPERRASGLRPRRHILAVEPASAPVGAIEAANYIEQCRFAAT